MDRLCPHCRQADGDRVDSTVDDTGSVTISFVCPECDRGWDVSL